MIVGYHITKDKLTCTTGTVYGKDENWLTKLLNDNPYDAKIFYDLDYSVAALLYHEGVTPEQGKELLTTHKLHLYNGYRLGYYPRRIFTVDYGYGASKGYAYFYNAKQFKDVHHTFNKTVSYTINKAKEAQEVSESVLEAYDRLGIADRSLTSPIKSFEKSYLYPDIPTVDDIPEEAGEVAYQSIKGNWVECYKMGHWDKAYDYDINGAYGAELAKLLDLRQGTWVHSKTIPSDRNTAPYGFARGTITIETLFHPFITNRGNMSYTPVGSWEACLTLQEIDFLRQNRLGDFKVEDCWYWTTGYTMEVAKPFKATVERLWEAKQDADAVTNSIVKRILAGIWGKMLELRGIEDNVTFGERFNPVYGAIVEANNRLKVTQVCLDNKIVPLAVAVDGIITNRPLMLDYGSGLGQWRLSHQGKCIIVSSGIIGIEGKKADEEFSISYDWLAEKLGGKPKQSEYTMEKIAPVTLARALNNNEWDKLGELVRTTRTVYIGGDTKRCYIEEPKCGGAILSKVYSSEPWDISFLTGWKTGELE